jgi:LacI family transcriptional regulator
MAGSTTPGKPSMKDVAGRARVALSSVSRVLNNHPDVSSEMRARVLAAVAELGYEPDLIASGLRRGVTKTVGFLVTDIANPLFGDITKGAERAFQEAGYSLLLMNGEGDPLRDERSIRLLSQRRVDGLILSVSDETSPQIARVLSSLEIPIVLLDRELDTVKDASTVLSDHATGMREAVDHLLGLGHRRVALLVGPLTIRPDRERLEGFKDAFRRRRVTLPRQLIEVGPSLSAEFGSEATDRLLRLPADEKPTAIVAGGNLVLTGVLRACREHGIRIGHDMAIVSCDDVPLAELHAPPITVIARDTVEMGRRAAEVLLRRMQGPKDGAASTVLLPASLLVRDSTS